jgi:UDP-3-O-[3-hydroxymyristoyl] glucosamine N-acyltransferase
MPSLTAAQLAQQLDGEVVGDASVTLTGFATPDRAKAGDLLFAENEMYFAAAEASSASAILVPEQFTSSKKTLIRVKNSRIAFARVLPLFFPETVFAPGIHPTAVVAPGAQVDATAYVGPHCAIGERARVGARTALLGGNHVGADAEIGADCLLFPSAVIYHQCVLGNRVRIHSGTVIGADGFGFVFDQGQHRKVLQIGNVVIHDDVEIGANSCVDRGALGSTVIGRGTKIDNQVQIAHNVIVGEHCLIAAQGAIAGSSKIGNYCVLAGQVAVSGHVKVGNQVTLAARTGVMNDLPDNTKWWGAPQLPEREAKRQVIAMRRLPDLLHRVAELEKKLAELSAKPGS